MSPWERRERGGLYYTRSRREGDRVVREYIGAGPLAEKAAVLDDREKRWREEEAAVEREERERLDALDEPVEELFEAVEVLTSAALLAAGYHKHKREWRKRRG
jgi:hypothetical protein